jgi:hypothetical protein
MQYSWLKEKGAFEWVPSQQRFRVDFDKMERGIRELTALLVRFQGNGDYAGTKSFFDRYARLDEQARMALARTAAIPTDIQPIYPPRV